MEEDIKNQDLQSRFDQFKMVNYDYYQLGIKSVDDRIGGVRKKTLTMLAGKSGTGKTEFTLWMFRSFNKQNAKVTYFNMELEENMILRRLRLFPHFSFTKGSNIINGRKSYYEVVNYIRTKKPDIVIIDWLNLMISDEDSGRALVEQIKIARGLAQLAIDENVAIILLNQMNKMGTSAIIDWYAGVAGSSAVYNAAHMFIGLYNRTKALTPHLMDDSQLKGIIEVHIDKTRDDGQRSGIVYARYIFADKTKLKSAGYESLDGSEEDLYLIRSKLKKQ